MEKLTWFEKMEKSFEKDLDYQLETIILDLTESISRRMQKKNISRTELAKVLGVSPPAITKILKGNNNFTLKTLLLLANALDLKLEIGFRIKKTAHTIVPHDQMESSASRFGTEKDY